MRTILKVLGVILIILFIVLLCVLERVDHSPYFESDYYQRTISQLDSISNQLSQQKGKVHVGFGKESITPGFSAKKENSETGIFQEVPLAGYGSRKGTFAEGIHDSLFVKAAAIQVQEQILVLVGSDILIVPPNISEGVSRIVKEKMGIKREQLYFSATHTHSGVGAWSEGYVGKEFAGLPNPEIVKWLTLRFSEAIISAIKDLQPGSLGSGSFEAPDLIRNRLIGNKGEENSQFLFLIAKQDTGRKAILGSFSAHATTLGGWNMQLSADYPGYWQRKLEKAKFDMAVFFAGSVGSHSPDGRGEGFKKSEYIGEILADSVLKCSQYAGLKDSISLASLHLRINLPELHIRVTDNLRLRPAVGKKLFPPIGDVYLQTAKIGDLIWSTAPCDFSGEITIVLRNAMNNLGYKLLITSFNGSYVGYIIPGKYYHLNEYESRLMSWFGPYMGPYTTEMLHRMMDKMTSTQE